MYNKYTLLDSEYVFHLVIDGGPTHLVLLGPTHLVWLAMSSLGVKAISDLDLEQTWKYWTLNFLNLKKTEPQTFWS